jgi:Concanavalin A-like lectin/glucanases superfamily
MAIQRSQLKFSKSGYMRFFLVVLLCGLGFRSFAQTEQLVIPRVSQMPNFPAPYLMRDWKGVSLEYDELVFSSSLAGQYLPLMHLKPAGINYPLLQPMLLDTYVGSSYANNQAEAINIIPALVSATLVGIDKSNQNGINWVEKAKDFFNKANGENVYLNGYSSSSGADWWYDLMPNVFFYQLYTQYPDEPDFDIQFRTVADRWLSAVDAMGGSTTPWQVPNMNYRGWKLASMTPNNTGVIEPEASGTISWLLYHAYLQTRNKKYSAGAQQAMEFLSGLDSNPSYELQLPYGAYVAARMNAELGTHYDMEKIVNWCFDRSSLRDWGVIAGKWNGSDVSGLVGEANDTGDDYAFVMNGFQQAAALVPMVKYDKRFAHDIGKWILNLANASRLFYPQYLPEADQDDNPWSIAHDPQSVIAYEGLKEDWNGKKLYGTGDAKNEGWAATNLGVYGSSHVGYLGAIVESTDVEGILKLDVNKTDFSGQNVFPSFLVFNPYNETKTITLPLGLATYDIYDAISETVIETAVTEYALIDVTGNEVMLLVYLPAGSAPEARNGKLYVGNDVVDYHYGYDFEGVFRIKSLNVSDTVVAFNQEVSVYSEIENSTEATAYAWYVNGVLSATSHGVFSWNVPDVEGTYKILLEVNSGSSSAKDSINLKVLARIPVAPAIAQFNTDKMWYYAGEEASIICIASNSPAERLAYSWTTSDGLITSQNDSLVHWDLPSTEGLFEIFCDVTNSDGLKAQAAKQVLVKVIHADPTPLFAYYPLDGDVLDYGGSGHDGVVVGAQPSTDPRGEPGKAYRFSSGSDIIFVENEPALNFKDQITVSFWVKLDAIAEESFILSHGSWEERWKVSVTPDRRLRWTIKTDSGTKDLDSSFPLELDHFYHFAVLYSGYSMELYADGVLDTFLPHSGSIAVTGKALTFGRKDVAITNYSLLGSLDEVRIYDKALAPNEIETLKSLWNLVTDVETVTGYEFILYPIPSHGVINIAGVDGIRNVEVWDLAGRKMNVAMGYQEGSLFQIQFDSTPGLFIVKIETLAKTFYRKIIIR